jgi:hypothetical protein
MSYTYYITETLKEVQNTLYKMIEIRVILDNSKFQQRALVPCLRISDNTNNNVDLSNLKNIKFIFPATTIKNGAVDIDTIEFTN